ncbi:class II aldolase/adducin family protein [bacterium]
MEKLIRKYSDKLVEHGLCDPGTALVAGLDADLVWNRDDERCGRLSEIFKFLNINSLIFSKPKEPFFSIINYLAKDVSAIYPQDCETRTFLHSIPVAHEFSVEKIVSALNAYKSVVIPDYGIVTFGTVSPEQAFVTFSSVCFSTYIKFFIDYYEHKKKNQVTKAVDQIFEISINFYKKFIEQSFSRTITEIGPLENSGQVLKAMEQAGRLIVECRLVDSFFGNISFMLKDKIYISQTGSSLDELNGCIDACPVNGSSCTGITASSELTAHNDIFKGTDVKAILHGHPKFCVIMSMICDEKEHCKFRDVCHIKCPNKRFIKDIPIVPGEVGTGTYGLCNTLPPAVKGTRGAVVYGHGLFTVTNKPNFTEAFENMINIEYMCLEKYLEKIKEIS